MKVSLNTVKQYTDIDLSVDELVHKINQQLGGVEEVISMVDWYKDAIIVKIVSAEQHPDADRLKVCKIDDGGVAQDVERDENGYVQVVCGAPNAREGILVVWLPPKAVVPLSMKKGEPFYLESRELRGVMSHGMLAGSDELCLSDTHESILEIDPGEWKPNDVEVKPGASFAEAYGLDDTIIDIENKMFTHRPDLFGQLGVAREIAGIQHKSFVSPEWYQNLQDARCKMEDGEPQLALAVTNEAKEKVPRFMAVALKDVAIKPSPLWLQCELVRLGGKPINNIVDVTNYVMLLTAQPLHAYDYDKLRGQALGARFAQNGEKLTLLNGKTYELVETDIVITDGEGPVGLGGVMGGGNSEVSDETKNVVLECATFDMYAIRKTSMRHGLFTDAVTRFNKGQSPLQNSYVLALAMKSIFDTAGGVQASDVCDESAELSEPKSVEVSDEFINDRLGLKLDSGEIAALLGNVELDVAVDGGTLSVRPAFWRTDIEIPEDIVEEVGRLYGLDKLPNELPKRSTKPAPRNVQRMREQTIRESLSRAGANEVLTYSFVHGNVLAKAGQDSSHAFRLSNPLSPDLQYYRLSLTPSLLANVHMNQKAGYDKFALFEIGKTHFKGEMDADEPEVPNEDTHIALVLAYDDKQQPAGASYYHARRYLGQILDLEAVTIKPLSEFDAQPDEWGKQLVAPYEPARSAVIVKNDQIFGVIGEFKADVQRAFKLPRFTAGFEVHFDAIVSPKALYKPLSRFPSTERDICFKVAESVSYGEIVAAAKSELDQSQLETNITPVDIFQEKGADTKNMTIRIKLSSHAKTLSGEEVNQVVDTMAQTVARATNATVI